MSTRAINDNDRDDVVILDLLASLSCPNANLVIESRTSLFCDEFRVK